MAGESEPSLVEMNELEVSSDDIEQKRRRLLILGIALGAIGTGAVVFASAANLVSSKTIPIEQYSEEARAIMAGVRGLTEWTRERGINMHEFGQRLGWAGSKLLQNHRPPTVED